MAEEIAGWSMVHAILSDLLRAGKITLTFGSVQGNPYIKRFPDLSAEEQRASLQSEDPSGICVYPSASVLALAVDAARYEGRPFTHRLALG